MRRHWRAGCVSRPPFWKAVAPTSTRRGGFALFRGRQAGHERCVVMTAELEPEQFENPRADFLLSFAHRVAVLQDQPGNVLLLSLIHISEPTRRTPISYAVFCLKK